MFIEHDIPTILEVNMDINTSSQLSAVDMAIAKFNDKITHVEDIRGDLISRLKDVCNNMGIDPDGESPRAIEIKLAAIKTLDDLLKSSESSAANAAKIAMQQKHDATSEATQQMVIELLKNINTSAVANHNAGQVAIPDDLDRQVSSAIEASNQPIHDDELEMPNVDLV